VVFHFRSLICSSGRKLRTYLLEMDGWIITSSCVCSVIGDSVTMFLEFNKLKCDLLGKFDQYSFD